MNSNLYCVNGKMLIVDYDEFCDEQKIYKSGNNDFAEQVVTSFKKLHQAILEAFDNNKVVKFFQEDLKSEDDYKAFLRDNQYRYGDYVYVLKKRCAYEIEK